MRRLVPGLAALLWLALAGGSVAAQEPDSTRAEPAPPPPPATGGWAAYAAVAHPWSTVVALTVVLPAGSADDPEDLEGTAWLLGETSAEALRSRLGEGVVRVEADVGRARTVYRVLTVPGAWTRAYRALEEVLFEGVAGGSALEEARAGLLSVHAFEAGAPVREFEREMYRVFSGAADPWSRDPRGVPESVERIGSEDLARFRRRHYDRGRAVLSVTGAVSTPDAARLVIGETPGDPDGGGPRVAVLSEPEGPAAPAWSRADRVHRIRDITSGWIAAAWPVKPGTSRTAAEMVAHQARSQLVTVPPAPGLFSAEVELQDLPGGQTALVIRAAVLPESVDAWEARILETLDRISSDPMEPGFFRFHRRQFRNLRLARDADPAEEGLRVALDLRRTGTIRDLSAEIWQMDAEALHGAAASLGPPRILVFGPDLSSEGGGSGEP